MARICIQIFDYGFSYVTSEIGDLFIKSNVKNRYHAFAIAAAYP